MYLLQPKDKIQIVAPARSVTLDELQYAIRLFETQGWQVVLGKYLFGKHHQFSGTDTERILDMQSAIDNPEISAIVCARGGYGGMRIVDKVDFSPLKTSPKWLCGYSDTTVFHTHIHSQLQMPTLHCTMPINMNEELERQQAHLSMIQALQTGSLTYEIEARPYNRKGVAEGVLVGGNLSLLYAVNNSVSDIDTAGKVLFIEDLDEYLYHIDRMMLCLKRAGKLKSLKALIVGGMSDMHDNTVPFGQDAIEIILSHVKEYDYPVCFDFPAGHISDNRALILGGKVRLAVDEKKVTLVNYV